MGRNNYFQFKQFKVIQEKSGMKVGTDGILLGSWVDPHGAKRVLDIGTGTGLLTLMIAQKSGAIITGVEIERDAADEAMLNVTNSNWSDRIHIIHSSVQEFTTSCTETFDLIISNPPFFEHKQGIQAKGNKRAMARQDRNLPFEELVHAVSAVLSKDGRFCVILPPAEFRQLEELAVKKDLFPARIMEVSPKPGRSCNRIIAEFSYKQDTIVRESIEVYNVEGDSRSDDFNRLSKDYYL